MSVNAYHYVLFPPPPPSEWVRFKRLSTGCGIARRLWDQREELRRSYEAEHGADKRGWPVRHPGVVLDAVPQTAHAACLGCAWLGEDGVYMEIPDWRERAGEIARRHQESTR